jgi:hypothetical protein
MRYAMMMTMGLAVWVSSAAAAPSSVVPQPRPAADGTTTERPTPYPRPEQVTDKTLLELIREAEAASAAAEDEAWLQDPFVWVERDMGRVSDLLDKQRSDEPVQRDQREIIRKLDVLIEKLNQASQNTSGGAGGGSSGQATNNPTSPMQDSQLTGGPGGMGELRDPDRDPKQWSDLPPKDREKILQSKTDGFPAGYEQVLEDYYRKLAEADGPAEAVPEPVE